jgi:hypothetical protein
VASNGMIFITSFSRIVQFILLMHATQSMDGVREKERLSDTHSSLLGFQKRSPTFAILTIRVCVQKFPDWPPGARTANDTALCH